MLADMDRTDVERWIEGYRRAWASDATDEIAALFTEDATYSPFPWPPDRAWRGRDAIVEGWQGHGDSKLGWRFEHEILAVDGDVAVIKGRTFYDRTGDTPYEDAYANIWVVRLTDDGRASSFEEWWVQRPHE